MSKICFLIPDGVGIRNYLYSDILQLLNKEGHEILVWHALNSEVIDESVNVNGFRPEEISFKGFKEDGVTQLLRESTSYARLKRGVELTGNETLMDNWHSGNFSFQKKLLVKLSEGFGKKMSTYESITQTEKLLQSKIRIGKAYKTYRALLSKKRPDLLFCTHQRMAGASAAILAAQDLGIQTGTAIFSWDNLPKARLAMRPDFFLVWSEYMAKELQFYYPEIEKDKILITGTPQFDFYQKHELLQSREDFAKENGLDPSKKWIVFSGDDAKTSPYDSKYLEDIAKALKGNSSLQILFRQVPVEDTSRYQQVLESSPHVIHINPYWKKGEYWNQYFPYPKDISHLVNLAYHCETVINIGSTMALDFAFFDKPGLYLNYDHQPNQAWSVDRVYRFQHFRSMDGLDAVGWINHPDEIAEKVNETIREPEKIGKDRKAWLNKITLQKDQESSSSRISAFFLEVLSQVTIN